MAERKVAPPLEPGTRFVDKYLIRRKLGGGGMGQVFEAVQEPIDRTVAIKVLHPKYVADRQIQQRFRQEAQAASQLSHPNTITIYDFGQTDEDLYFIVMEYLEGESLAEVLDRHGPLPLEDVVPLVIQVAQSLGEAHRKGIIHRDLKPDNIMVVPSHSGPPRVKVLDFGIAKLVDHSAGLTKTGSTFGTPGYMAPEQARGREVTPATDFYALTCCLYELLTGDLPYTGQTVVEIMMKHQEDDIPTLGEGFPPSLDLFLRRTLAKPPDDRPQSADDYVAALLGGFADDRAEGFSFQEPGPAGSGVMFSTDGAGGAADRTDLGPEEMPATDPEPPSDDDEPPDIQNEFRAFDEQITTTEESGEATGDRDSDEDAAGSTDTATATSADARHDSDDTPTTDDAPDAPHQPTEPSPARERESPAPPARAGNAAGGGTRSLGLGAGLVAAAVFLAGGIAIGTFTSGSADRQTASPTTAEDDRMTLTVASQPDGAVVSLDGDRVGTTPIDLELPRDETVTLQIDKKGYRAVRRQDVDPTTFAQQRFFADLAERTLEVTVISPVPRADLTIDGESYGHLPVDQPRTLQLDWPDSPLTLEIDAPGYEPYVTKIPTAALEPTLTVAPARSELVPRAGQPAGDGGEPSTGASTSR